jgi:hypothetical protein
MTTKRGFEAMRKALVTIDTELNHAREAGEIYAYNPLCQRLEAIQRHIARALNVAAGKDSARKVMISAQPTITALRFVGVTKGLTLSCHCQNPESLRY